MKNLTILTVVITTMIFSCDQNSSKQVIDAKAKIAIAKQDLKDIQRNESDSIKAKTTAEWLMFRTETDKELARMDEDITKFDSSMIDMNARDKQKLNSDYYQAKNDITKLRDKLNEKSRTFENDMQASGDRAEQENENFRRYFKNELVKVDQDIKKLFRNDKK